MFGIKLSETGDTIVEVLIAIVVISAVLSGAFLVSRASLKHVRDSEEHSQALQLVQSQVELLRDAAAQQPDGSSFPAKFCMAPAATSSTDAACTVNAEGKADSNGLYHLSIVSTDPSHHTYQATAAWDSVNGGTAQVQLSYRVVYQSP